MMGGHGPFRGLEAPLAPGASLERPLVFRKRRGIVWYAGPAHRGVTHVRGKDCVHPDIDLVVVRMISFPARESGQRARKAVR